jgi:hypothetical protein
MASYSVKLVYLPDYSHPMSLQMKSGWFGTTTMAPTLTDGWMLASLNGSADAGTANTISALAALVTGGGSSSGGKAGGAKGGSGNGTANADEIATRSFGERGPAAKGKKKFYELSDEEMSTLTDKIIQGESPAPTPQEIGYAADHQLGDRVDALMKSLIASALKSKKSMVSWGTNVLPPGLYEFSFSSVQSCSVLDERIGAAGQKLAQDPRCSAAESLCSTGDAKCRTNRVVGGELDGLKPVMYFCAEGPVAPQRLASATYVPFGLLPNVIASSPATSKIDPSPCVHQ